MRLKNKLTQRLGIRYPIVQGPFGGGFSTPSLTATVSNCGGLGSFGAHNLNAEQIIDKVAQIRSLTAKPFAVNLWISSADDGVLNIQQNHYEMVSNFYKNQLGELGIGQAHFTKKFGEDFEDQIEGLIEARPAVFSFVFGIPSESIINRCREKGIVTVGTATTLDEALAVERAGIDCLIVSGSEAGGHRPSFLRAAEDSLVGLNALLSVVSEEVRIPIIAAGGIVTSKQIQAAQLLGADGVQMGTAFLACEESGASPIHREMIFSERVKNTTLSRSYTGRLARFIENDFLLWAKDNHIPYLPYPVQNYLLAEMKKVASGRGLSELAPLYAGQGGRLVKHRKAKELFESLINELKDFNQQGD